MARAPKPILFGSAVAVAVLWNALAHEAPKTQAAHAWTESSVDLVIKDKHGRPVHDLSPSDLQIFNNGKPVRITSVTKASGALLGAEGDGGPLRFVAFVLNSNDDVSRSLARDALTALSKAPNPSNIYVALWDVHEHFALLHNFSNDLAGLKTTLVAKRHEANSPAAVAADPKSGNPVAVAQRTALQVLESGTQLVKQQHAKPAIAALLALARGEKQIAGRKMLLFFSNDVQVATARDETIKLIVSEANRSEVSFYCVDAGGVSERAAEQAARTLIDTAGLAQAAAGHMAMDPNTTYTTDMQAAQNVTAKTIGSKKNSVPGITAGSNTNLRALSAETGGSYTNGPNTMRKFVHSALEDTQTFYEVAYQQPIENADATFRTLSVRVDHSGWRIQSRAGMFPSLLVGGKELSGFEIPLLKSLSGSSRKETIWFSGAAYPESHPGAPPFINLAVDVPLSGLMAHEFDATRRFRFRLSILALLKDASGQVIDKTSRDTALEGALEHLSQARSNSYSFTAAFTAAPKGCHVDIAIRDEFASKISTKTIACSSSPPKNLPASEARLAFQETADNLDAEALATPELGDPKLLKNGPQPSQTQIDGWVEGAKVRVLDYKRSLPNFVCIMATRRFVAATGSALWKPIDSSSSLLTYIAGKETTVLLDLNGHPVHETSTADDPGAQVEGEFGDFIAMPFSDKASAKIDWEGETELMGKKMEVLRFTVSREHSTYLLERNGAEGTFFTAYHAFIYIDPETLAIRRVSIMADDLPPDSFIRQCQLTLDYDYIPITGNEFLLPVHASLIVRRHGRTLNRNEIDFQDYRKYGAESKLLVDK